MKDPVGYLKSFIASRQGDLETLRLAGAERSQTEADIVLAKELLIAVKREELEERIEL